MLFSRFSEQTDNIVETVEATWPEFTKFIQNRGFPVTKSKGKSPAFSPAFFKQICDVDAPSLDSKCQRGAGVGSPCILHTHTGLPKRNALGAEHLSMAVADFDSGVTSLAKEQITSLLQDYNYVLHTTYSHHESFSNDGLWKMRIIFPLDRVVTGKDWPNFWEHFRTLFQPLIIDRACRDASRLYFLPAIGDASHLISGVLEINTGVDLSVDEILDLDARPGVSSTSIVVYKEPVTTIAVTNTLKTDALSKTKKVLNKRKISVEQKSIHQNLISMLNGDLIASMGSRDETLLRMTNVLADWYPTANPNALSEWFAASQKRMQNDGQLEVFTLEDVANKIQRKQQTNIYQDGLEFQKKQEESVLAIQTARNDGQTEKYSEVEITAMCKEHQIPRSQFEKHLVLCNANGTMFFALTLDGYQYAGSRFNWHVNAAEMLAPTNAVFTEMVGLVTPKQKLRDEKILLKDYVSMYESVTYYYNLAKSVYDYKQKTLKLSAAMRSSLQPQYHAEADEFFRLLGGSKAETFLDWLAVFPDTTMQIASIYINAGSGFGKTSLAQGLAKLWRRETYVEPKDLFGQFNYELSKTPFCFVDESFPDMPSKVIHSFIRNFVGGGNYNVSQKFQETIPLTGHRRLLMSANNPNMISFSDANLTDEDIEAVNKRIIRIVPNPKTPAFWDRLGNNTPESNDMRDRKIPEHVLWLEQTRKNDVYTSRRGSRFVVEGNNDNANNSMLSDKDKETLLFVLRVLIHEGAVKPKYLICAQSDTDNNKNEIWISPQNLVDECWTDFMRTKPPRHQNTTKTWCVKGQYWRHPIKDTNSGKLLCVPALALVDTEKFLSFCISQDYARKDILDRIEHLALQTGKGKK